MCKLWTEPKNSNSSLKARTYSWGWVTAAGTSDSRFKSTTSLSLSMKGKSAKLLVSQAGTYLTPIFPIAQSQTVIPRKHIGNDTRLGHPYEARRSNQTLRARFLGQSRWHWHAGPFDLAWAQGNDSIWLKSGTRVTLWVADRTRGAISRGQINESPELVTRSFRGVWGPLPLLYCQVWVGERLRNRQASWKVLIDHEFAIRGQLVQINRQW